MSAFRIGLVAAVSLLIMGLSIWLAWALLGDPPPREIRGPMTLIDRDRRGIRLRLEARRKLERYEWVDREKRVVRIPIERAMELRAKGEER